MARDYLRLCDLTERVLFPLARTSERLDLEVALAAFRSALTIAEVYGAADAGAHVRMVQRWVRGRWQAYVALHPLARRWVEEALVGP